MADKTTSSNRARSPASPSASEAGAARCLVALNPRSRRGGEVRETLLDTLSAAGFEIAGGQFVPPEELGEALRRHGAELRSSTDCIFVGGGDGTINRLLPVLLEAPVPTALLPLGTANDLARTLGVAADLTQAVAVGRRGRSVAIDVGRVNGHLFVNVASMGLGPAVTARLSAELKDRLGVLGYPRALLSAYRETRPFRCRLALDGGPEVRLHAVHLAVGNGRCYGGGAVVHADAAVDDGRLDLYALSPMPLWRLLLVAPWIGSGRHGRVEETRSLHGVTLRVRTSRRLPISADGEIVGRTPAVFEVVPRALSVRVPRGQPGAGVSQLRTPVAAGAGVAR